MSLYLTVILTVTGSFWLFGRGYAASLLQISLGTTCLIGCMAVNYVLALVLESPPTVELIPCSRPVAGVDAAIAITLSIITAGVLSALAEFVAVSILGRAKGN